MLGEAAALEVKLLRFGAAAEKLAESLRLSPSEAARRLRFDCLLALACRAAVPAPPAAPLGQRLRERLQLLGYEAAGLCRAAGVPSPLHLVSNRPEAFAHMAQAPLPQLLRLLLLRQAISLEAAVELLGPVVEDLLRLQLLRVIDQDLLDPLEAVQRLGRCGDAVVVSPLAWWPVEGLLIATDYGDTPQGADFEPVMCRKI